MDLKVQAVTPDNVASPVHKDPRVNPDGKASAEKPVQVVQADPLDQVDPTDDQGLLVPLDNAVLMADLAPLDSVENKEAEVKLVPKERKENEVRPDLLDPLDLRDPLDSAVNLDHRDLRASVVRLDLLDLKASECPMLEMSNYTFI